MSVVVEIAAVSAVVGWWQRAGWGQRTVALLGVLGVACVALSLLPAPGPDAAWLRDFLMTVGSSLALFAPFYLLTRSLDRHLDKVAEDAEKRANQVAAEADERNAALAGEVEALRADVDRRLDAVAEQVTARLAAEAEADHAAFAALRTKPTRETFVSAFERAQGLGLVSTNRPPRVNISRTSALYASVDLDLEFLAAGSLHIRVENLSGDVEEWVAWPEGRDAADVLVEVGRALLKHTGEVFDATAFLGGLADLLEAALSRPERRPAIELCPPQWMVCEWGVTTYDQHNYGVNLPHLQTSDTIESHVAAKAWVDEESWEAAYVAALALFPPPDPWTARGQGEPPF